MTPRPNCGTMTIVELAVVELRKHADQIERLLPCKVTLHLPPPGSRDPPCLEVQAKLKDADQQ